MLDKFYKYKLEEIAKLETLYSAGKFPPFFRGERGNFQQAICPKNGKIAIIAEFKQSSPSRGEICKTLTVEEASSQYMANGAAALSILTEEHWFSGSLDFIQRAWNVQKRPKSCPILRKDFIFHPLQIEATASTPAAALLLIARMIPEREKLAELQNMAESYGIQCVVEVFDKKDLDLARSTGARIIQVNARDLDTLKTDRKACLDLISKQPPRNDEIWIAASGIENRAQVEEAQDAGFDAVLVGSSLMKDGQPGKALARLLRG